ncbi:MAG: DUF2461 domain-containing protein [Marinifilaceae bacterium]|jgi:uncharacterized protein (TIGR02453 family)|nr:DUF2461 domain-containing protein [Marinifilaceae bacterium]
MTYFNREYIEFFKNLEKHNYKEWFHENKKSYISNVKQPFDLFTQEMILRIQEFDDSIDKDPKNAIFRINKDIRFSQDKSPYKTHRAASFAKGGRKAIAPGYYIQIGAHNINFGGGIYFIDTKCIKVIREHIINNQDEFNDIINDNDFVKYFGEIHGNKNKRLPKEQMQLVDKIPLLLNKQLYYMDDIETEKVLFSENLLDFFVDKFKTASRFNKFILEAID